MRSIGSKTISFGLVSIPVKLYTATRDADLKFNQLTPAGNRIQQKKVDAVTGEPVSQEQLRRGYEVAKDTYVVIEDGEIESVRPPHTDTVDIESFVALSEIDPIRYESTTYLGPDKGADKAYSLLLNGLKKSKKVAVARVVLRTKQHVCVIRPIGQALAMSTLYLDDEIVPDSEIPTGSVETGKNELDMALMLINAKSGAFNSGKYRDEYRLRLLELINMKAKGEAIPVGVTEAAPAASIDLMAALEASLVAAKKGA